jgi:hypothetical protein
MKNPMPLRFAASVALTLAVLGARPASANYSLALDITGNQTAFYTGGPGVTGWSFQTAAPLLFYGIGFFDPASQPSLGAAVEVGLWDSGGNLLASGAITNTTNDVVVPSIDCCGEWLFDTNGSPIEVLAPGTYVLGALISDTQPVIAAAITAPTFPGVTFLENLQGSGASGLVEPTATSASFGLGFFGPNLLVGADPTAAPEPATFGLVAGALALGAFLYRRRTRAIVDADRFNCEDKHHVGEASGCYCEPSKRRSLKFRIRLVD